MAGTVYVDIVSPQGSVFKGEVRGVKAPGVMGSFTVLHNHAPMIAAFELGQLVITDSEGTPFVYATSGGFLEVLNNKVTVLAETAEPASAIDVERAKASEQRALERLANASPEERAKIQADLDKARNRLRASISKVGGSR